MRPMLVAWKGGFPFNVHPQEIASGSIEENPRVLVIRIGRWTLEVLLYKRCLIK
jgi:hypothetical protein